MVGIDMINFVDVELANPQRSSICAMGLISVRQGQIVLQKSYLIDPQADFAPINIGIHGIHPIMVQGCPTFSEIWDEVGETLSSGVIVAHNAASMDVNAICATLTRYGITPPQFKYFCTYCFAKANMPGLNSYKLPDLCASLGLSCFAHHDAMADTIACKAVYDTLTQRYPISKSDTHIYHYKMPMHPDQPYVAPCKSADKGDSAFYIKSIAHAKDFYDNLLATDPAIACAFPEFTAGAHGNASIYLYRQKAVSFGVLKSKGVYVEIPSDYISDPYTISSTPSKRAVQGQSQDDESNFSYRFFLDFSDTNAILDVLHCIAKDKYTTCNAESFGCCNDFIRCSDARACLHRESWHALGCIYRKNLEAGRIFYGINANQH